MLCACNYLWVSAKLRSNLGMAGGSGLASVFSPSSDAHVSCWDQSTAFTSVSLPEWMVAWQAVPPLRAKDVWPKLSAEQRRVLDPMTSIYP